MEEAKGSEETIITTNPETGELEEMDLYTGEVIFREDKNRCPYNLEEAKQFCDLVRGGYTFANAAKTMDMSYAIISYWRSRHPDFDQAVKIAREERAEFFHDRVLEIAEGVKDKDEAQVARVQIDAYKWAAEKNDPAKFGNKNVHGGVGGVTIIVDTGVNSHNIDVNLQEEDYEFKESSTGRARELCTIGASDGDAEGSKERVSSRNAEGRDQRREDEGDASRAEKVKEEKS